MPQILLNPLCLRNLHGVSFQHLLFGLGSWDIHPPSKNPGYGPADSDDPWWFVCIGHEWGSFGVSTDPSQILLSSHHSPNRFKWIIEKQLDNFSTRTGLTPE